MTNEQILDVIHRLNQEIVRVEAVQTAFYKAAGNIQETVSKFTGSDEDKQILIEWRDSFQGMAVSLNEFSRLSYKYPGGSKQITEVPPVKIVDRDAN